MLFVSPVHGREVRVLLRGNLLAGKCQRVRRELAVTVDFCHILIQFIATLVWLLGCFYPQRIALAI